MRRIPNKARGHHATSGITQKEICREAVQGLRVAIQSSLGSGGNAIK
jgi:hypothetical protein